jgi:hypothetical protein
MRRMVLIALTLLVPLASSGAAQGARPDGEQPLALDTTGGAAAPSTALRLPANLFDPFPSAAATPVGGAAAEPTDAAQSAAGRQPGGGAQLPPTTAPPRDTPPPPPDPNSARRRGSMVGYIEDTLVGSKVRVRFDIGLHSHTPDRAEFFYAKCGCYRTLSVTDSSYDPKAAGPGPGNLEDLNFQQLYVEAEYAATERFSVFGELPLRWLQPQEFVGGTGSFPNQSGISDLRAGAKLALTATAHQALTAQVKFYLPSGDALKGLGTDHASIEPAILYYQQLSDRAALESMVSVWLPFGGSDAVPTSRDDRFAGNVLSYGIGPSFDLYRSRDVRFSPVVELVGWRVLSGFQTPGGDASGTNIVNLKFGARASWGRGGSIYFGYGRALTEADWYNDIFRFEYRVSF